MFLVYAALLALLTVPLLGGRLSALADVELRRPWLVAAALGTQVVITTLLPGAFDGVLGGAVQLGTYALLAAFLWSNRWIVGLPVVTLGASMNFAAITANEGVMPASRDALELAGLPHDTAGRFENSAALEEAELAFFGDVFAIPQALPASNVFSLGDVVIFAGLLVALHVLCGSRAVPLSVSRG